MNNFKEKLGSDSSKTQFEGENIIFFNSFVIVIFFKQIFNFWFYRFCSDILINSPNFNVDSLSS